MRILLLGAYGLIGAACLARLHRDGHEVVALGRSIGEAKRRFPHARWVAADLRNLTNAAAWRPLLAGIDAVVNCAGALQGGGRDDLRKVHVVAMLALFAACKEAGVRRIVQLSAIGADATGPSDFARTKAEADAALAASDLDWVILRPALVWSPTAYGGSAMLRALAALPLVTPVVAPDTRVQVVAVADVAETVARAVEADAPARVIWDVAHPQVHALRDIVAALRGWLGYRAQPLVAVPGWAGRIVATVADALGLLGWRSPARTTALKQLGAGVVGDPSGWMAATGIRPQGLAEILANTPAGVQDRWFAKLYLLKAVTIAGLALFWIGTGVIALGPGKAAATAHMIRIGASPAMAEATVILGALFDVALGLLLCFAATARWALRLMLIATPLYLLAGTILDPQLWIDPLGPLTKVIPLLVALPLTLAITDER